MVKSKGVHSSPASSGSSGQGPRLLGWRSVENTCAATHSRKEHQQGSTAEHSNATVSDNTMTRRSVRLRSQLQSRTGEHAP